MNTIVTRTFAAACLLGLAHSALAQDCQVLDNFPVEIDRPGKYCLDRSHALELTGSESAISIVASNVTLDLRGHTLSNPTIADLGLVCNTEFTQEPTNGIYVSKARNVHIFGGALRCFETGVHLVQGSCRDCNQGNQIESMRIHQSAYAGIIASGDFSVVSDNHIVEVGARDDRFVYGILIIGDGNTVINNDVQDVKSGAGIQTESSYGLVMENRVQYAEIGYRLYSGRQVRYRDNVSAQVQTAYTNIGTDLGNND